MKLLNSRLDNVEKSRTNNMASSGYAFDFSFSILALCIGLSIFVTFFDVVGIIGFRFLFESLVVFNLLCGS